jgi:hypothetical protein
MISSNSSLIAPCGMNCSVCMAFLREKNKCTGCRGSDLNKPKTRVNCKIKNCDSLKRNNSKFCYECNKFPCEVLAHLDKRYQSNYHMSMIENLKNIQQIGLDDFLKNEQARWTCSNCGGTIFVHTARCSDCGIEKFYEK